MRTALLLLRDIGILVSGAVVTLEMFEHTGGYWKAVAAFIGWAFLHSIVRGAIKAIEP